MSHVFRCRPHPFHPLSRHSCKRCSGALSCDINPSVSVLVCAPQPPTHTQNRIWSGWLSQRLTCALEAVSASSQDRKALPWVIIPRRRAGSGSRKPMHLPVNMDDIVAIQTRGRHGKCHLPWGTSCAIREGLWPFQNSPKSHTQCVVLEDFLFPVCSSQIICSQSSVLSTTYLRKHKTLENASLNHKFECGTWNLNVRSPIWKWGT